MITVPAVAGTPDKILFHQWYKPKEAPTKVNTRLIINSKVPILKSLIK